MHEQRDDTSDHHLIEKILKGDVNAFEGILNNHGDHVLRIVKKHVPLDQAEEIAQEVFIRVYKSLRSFKGRSPFRHWLSTVAVRTCYDWWRKQYRSRELPMSTLSKAQQDWLEEVTAHQSDQNFEKAGRKQEARELLDQALNHLSAEDRMVIELVFLEELSVKEAASLLGWSAANVKIRSFRARKKLRRFLIK
jgi:RNA polymerase sigma-70 factor (ECF subfamily)